MAAEVLRKLIPVLGSYWKVLFVQQVFGTVHMAVLLSQHPEPELSTQHRHKANALSFGCCSNAVVVTVLLLSKMGKKRQGKQTASEARTIKELLILFST